MRPKDNQSSVEVKVDFVTFDMSPVLPYIGLDLSRKLYCNVGSALLLRWHGLRYFTWSILCFFAASSILFIVALAFCLMSGCCM